MILAAGSGSRLRSLSDSKPLLSVLGVPLIERNIRSMQEAGLREFIVVTGHQAERLEAFLGQLAERLGVVIRCVHNPDWATTENGYSVLAAESLISGPFVLAMADHLAAPGLLRQLIEQTSNDCALTLAVDRRLDNPVVDPTDVTRVSTRDQRLVAVGKTLTTYDCWDTGFFYCAEPARMFAALREAGRNGRSTLSDAVALLASEAQVAVVNIGQHYWNDVDTPRQLELARQWLLDQNRTKSRDGPVARHLNRPLSIRLSGWLAAWPVTPNQISLTSFAMSLAAAALIACGTVPALVAGGVLAQFASVIDGCDGEIARLKYQSSDYGGWLDAVLDRYADAALLLGLTWAWASQAGTALPWLAGACALTGSFMVSYTADKYDHWAQQQQRTGWRMGRDLRVLLIALGAITGLIAPLLWLIALLMNGEALRRVWILRPRRSAADTRQVASAPADPAIPRG